MSSDHHINERSIMCTTHHIDDQFPQALSLPLAQVLEDVTVLLVQQLEAHGQVMVLQHRLIVVHQRKF